MVNSGHSCVCFRVPFITREKKAGPSSEERNFLVQDDQNTPERNDPLENVLLLEESQQRRLFEGVFIGSCLERLP